MKTLFLILISFLLITGCNKEQSSPISTLQTDSNPNEARQDSVTTFIRNGHFNSTGDKYSFDIYSKSQLKSLRLGNSTYTLEVGKMYKFPPLANPELTYINPKFTLGSPGYYPMFVEQLTNEEGEDLIYLQIVYLQNQGSGSILNQTDELIATIELDVTFCIFELVWDSEYSFITYPGKTIKSAWYDYARGCL